MTATYIIGDVFDCLAATPTGSVDLVLTSPPFLALRSYLPADHPDKAKEIGSEPTPAEFLDTLLALTAEWRRVLAPHGSICVELGDTYAGSGGSGGDYADDGLRAGQDKFDGAARRRRTRPVKASPDAQSHRNMGDGEVAITGGNGWPLDKSLCGIPHLYHLSLAYGRNLLTGQPSPAGQWRVRNVVAWCRPNPPVGALGDKFRPGTSYMTVATIARDRYFDLDAVRTPHKDPTILTTGRAATLNRGAPGHHTDPTDAADVMLGNPAGAPPLDWWEIPTQPYPGSHYATWPEKLCVRPIKSMCPEKVCTTCGQPSRRITETERNGTGSVTPGRIGALQESGAFASHGETERTTVGWSDCGHDTWRPGLTLDPFAGSGTTLAVATGHGRDALGFDLDARNADLARERVGPMLFTDHHLTDWNAA